MKLFEGVRVLDLSRMLAGPYGSMLLADMGAEVIKVEEPDGGDPMRAMGPPFLPDGESAYFLAVNRNKKSVAIDLTKDDGRAVFLDLVRASAVAGALFQRARTGQGTHLDLSLLDCQVSLLAYMAQYFWTDGRVPGPMGSGHASVVPYQALATRDGHLIVAVFSEKFWGGFCRAAGRPEWEADPRFAANRDRVAHRGALEALIAARFAEDTTDAWLARLNAEGVPAAPINTIDRVLDDPQVKHREMVVQMDHPRHGPLPTLGTPIKADGVFGVEVTPPAELGQHTDEILRDLLGYAPEHIAALRRARAVA